MVFGKSGPGKKRGYGQPKRLMWVATSFYDLMKELSDEHNQDMVDLTKELSKKNDNIKQDNLFKPIVGNWRRIL